MTQAFNLSQFANNVNTSGQASLTAAVSGTLPVANGGTGATTLTSGAVLVGAGTGSITSVAPSTSGNVLTSNGSAWVSSTPAGGGVTSLNGQTGAITNTNYESIGSYVTGRPQNFTSYAVNSTLAGSLIYVAPPPTYYTSSGWRIAGTTVIPTIVLLTAGTWRCVSPAYGTTGTAAVGLWVRIS
jgi:hypothetical protein